MTNYHQLRLDLTPCSEDATDVMAALLADEGYESFVPDAEGLTAFIRSDLYTPEAVERVLEAFPFGCRVATAVEEIEGRDWNSEWERHYFKPIVVGSEVAIHSSFHADVPPARYDIVIDPKMAFGTGHHATTSQMIESILALGPLDGLTVTDMGTGTGILAILCAMRGAKEVNGVEIDPPAWENAVDNLRLNGVDATARALLGDAALLATLPPAALMLANINRNIITADLPRYVAAMKPGATLLLSGFYEADIPVIMAVAAPLGLTEVSHTTQGDWACLKLIRAF